MNAKSFAVCLGIVSVFQGEEAAKQTESWDLIVKFRVPETWTVLSRHVDLQTGLIRNVYEKGTGGGKASLIAEQRRIVPQLSAGEIEERISKAAVAEGTKQIVAPDGMRGLLSRTIKEEGLILRSLKMIAPNAEVTFGLAIRADVPKTYIENCLRDLEAIGASVVAARNVEATKGDGVPSMPTATKDKP